MSSSMFALLCLFLTLSSYPIVFFAYHWAIIWYYPDYDEPINLIEFDYHSRVIFNILR